MPLALERYNDGSWPMAHSMSLTLDTYIHDVDFDFNNPSWGL